MSRYDAPIEEIIGFSFDMKFNFEMLALQVERLWEATEEARK
jgi:hypothetical protein